MLSGNGEIPFRTNTDMIRPDSLQGIVFYGRFRLSPNGGSLKTMVKENHVLFIALLLCLFKLYCNYSSKKSNFK